MSAVNDSCRSFSCLIRLFLCLTGVAGSSSVRTAHHVPLAWAEAPCRLGADIIWRLTQLAHLVVNAGKIYMQEAGTAGCPQPSFSSGSLQTHVPPKAESSRGCSVSICDKVSGRHMPPLPSHSVYEKERRIRLRLFLRGSSENLWI